MLRRLVDRKRPLDVKIRNIYYCNLFGNLKIRNQPIGLLRFYEARVKIHMKSQKMTVQNGLGERVIPAVMQLRISHLPQPSSSSKHFVWSAYQQLVVLRGLFSAW